MLYVGTSRYNLYKVNKDSVNYALVSLKMELESKAFKVKEKQLEAPIVWVDNNKKKKVKKVSIPESYTLRISAPATNVLNGELSALIIKSLNMLKSLRSTK